MPEASVQKNGVFSDNYIRASQYFWMRFMPYFSPDKLSMDQQLRHSAATPYHGHIVASLFFSMVVHMKANGIAVNNFFMLKYMHQL